MATIEDEDGWEEVVAIPAGPNRLLEEETVPVRWLPLVRTSLLHPYWLGPTTDGDWVNSIPRRYEPEHVKPLLYADRYDPGYYYVMPLLEISPSVVRSQAIFEAERHALDGLATWERVPWRSIVRCGLRSLRTQWVSPAMDWVAAVELSADYRAELLAIADSDLRDEVRSRARRLGRVP